MAFVDECGAETAGTTVEVFVGAPSGEVDPPVVQVEFDVADRVREVETHRGADLVSGAGDLRHGQDLTGVVLDARQQDEREAVPVLGDGGEDVVGAKGHLAGSWVKHHE